MGKVLYQNTKVIRRWARQPRWVKRAASLLCAAFILFGASLPALLSHQADAYTAGPNSPTTGADNTAVGTTAWSPTANVTAQDTSWATNSMAAGGITHYLTATGYGFSIPTNATITGVTASIWRSSPTVSKSSVQDNAVRLVVGGTIQTTDRSNAGVTWPTANTAQTYGSSSDLWGATLTPASVNASNFGVAISAKNVKSGAGAANTGSVDYISVTIDYTLPPVYTQASYRLFNNKDASGGAMTFGTRADYTPNIDVRQVTTADFNGDGKQDIAATSFNGSVMSIFMNNGTGTFAAKVDYTVGTSQLPGQLAAADFNGDGKPDVAVADSQGVSVFINSGTGTFAAHVDYPTGNPTTGLTVADFNGDGKIDIAVDVQTAVTASVFMNNGNGTFATKVDYSISGGASNNPRGLASGDFNGDGKPDLVASDAYNGLSVLLNTGTGTFNPRVGYTLQIGSSASLVSVGDMNGDGKLDLVTADNGLNLSGFDILFGTGTGTFGTAAWYGDSPNGVGTTTVAIADYNMDGYPDVASGGGGNGVEVMLNDGSGGLGAPTVYTGTTNAIDDEATAAADFNNDNKPDIAFGNGTGTTKLSVILNTTTVSAIDVGTALAAANTGASVTSGAAFRLRMDVGVSAGALSSSGQSFKLQYAPMTTSCDTSFTNTTNAAYQDVTTTSTVAYYDNSVGTSGMTITPNANDPTDGSNTLVRQTYQETGTTTFSNASAIAIGQDGMWDFGLKTISPTTGASYCLRMVKSSGNLDTYSVIPKITIPGSNTAPNSPTTLVQENTSNVQISTGGWNNSTSIKFTADATDPDSSDTLAVCVEAQPIGTSFTNTETSCGTAVAYSGTTVNPTVTLTLTDATQYHWQMRLKDTAGAYSSWVSYGANLESASDFGIDTTAPTGGTVYDGSSAGVDTNFNDGSLTTLTANWSGVTTTVSGLQKYEYSVGTTAGGTDVKTWTSTGTTASMSDSALSLQTSKMYYVNVRTTDNAGNVSGVISSNGQVVPPSVSFTVSPATVTFNKLKASNSYTDTQTATLTTSTNAYGGYLVRAYATDLLRASNNQTISMFNGGTYASPAAWGSSTGFGYTSSDTLVQGTNKFSPATCLGGGSPPCYAPFSLTTPGDIVADHASGVLGSAVSAESFTVTYRVTVPSTQAATTYNTGIIYTVTPIY